MSASEKPREAIILAGGFGTRLREAVANVPKPMAPIGGRPFLEFLMDYWLEQGIEKFVLSVGYLADCVIRHFGKNYKGAELEYVYENEPLGTGGGLALAVKNSRWRGRHVLALNGDTWATASLAQLMADTDDGCALTLVLNRISHNDRYGGVELDASGRVRRFGSRPDGRPSLINVGCYVFQPGAWLEMTTGFPAKFSLEADFLESLAAQGKIGASQQELDFIDIGIAADYYRFCEMFGR